MDLMAALETAVLTAPDTLPIRDSANAASDAPSEPAPAVAAISSCENPPTRADSTLRRASPRQHAAGDRPLARAYTGTQMKTLLRHHLLLAMLAGCLGVGLMGALRLHHARTPPAPARAPAAAAPAAVALNNHAQSAAATNSMLPRQRRLLARDYDRQPSLPLAHATPAEPEPDASILLDACILPRPDPTVRRRAIRPTTRPECRNPAAPRAPHRMPFPLAKASGTAPSRAANPPRRSQTRIPMASAPAARSSADRGQRRSTAPFSGWLARWSAAPIGQRDALVAEGERAAAARRPALALLIRADPRPR